MAVIKRSLAVVIGINKYFNRVAPLETAVNDAKKLANLLEEKYGYQVLLLLDEQANQSHLNDLLTNFTEQKLSLNNGKYTIQLQKEDRLLFYFAGHGTPEDAENDTEQMPGYLIPQDGQRDNSKTWISMERLHDSLSQLPCRHLLVILDCCFAGTFRWAVRHREVMRRQKKLYRESYERFLSNRVQQVITSAAHDETAADSTYAFGRREKDNYGHSPFAEVLIRGLKGEADYTKDGVITAAELYVFLENELSKKNTKQTPELREFKRHEKGQYIFPLPEFDINLLPIEPKINQGINFQQNLESLKTNDRNKDPSSSSTTEKLVELLMIQQKMLEESQSFSKYSLPQKNDQTMNEENEQKSNEATHDVALRADWEYEKLVKQDSAYEKAIRNVMLRMVALDGNELIRRRVLDDELVYPEPENILVKQVIAQFCVARLLLRGQDNQGNGYIEPADDNLVRQWRKVITWKQQELGNLLLQRELTLKACNWDNQRRDKRAFRLLWANDPRLPLIKKLSLKKDIWFNSLELEFIKQSIQRQRYQLCRNIAISITIVGGAIASLVLFYLYRPEVFPVNQKVPKQQTLLPTQSPITESNQPQQIDKADEKNSFKAGNGIVNSLAFSSDGKTVIAGSSEGQLYFWNLQIPSTFPLLPSDNPLLRTSKSVINSVAFNPKDSHVIAAGTSDGKLRIWNLKQPPVETLVAHYKGVNSVVFSPNGSLLATGGNDSRVCLWNTQQGKLFGKPIGKPIVIGKTSVNSVAFDPKSQYVLVGSNDGKVSIWNRQGQPIAKPFFAHPKVGVNVVVFSPSGQHILTGGKDGKVSIWTKKGQFINTFAADQKIINSAFFIDNGKTILTGGSDGQIRFHDWKGKQVREPLKDPSLVKSIAVSRDGQKLVSGGDRGEINLRNLSRSN